MPRGLPSRLATIYIDRSACEATHQGRSTIPSRWWPKRVLVVLLIPSVERDGATPIDQQHWVDAALEMLGRVFGGATAYLKAKGIWRDDARNGRLVTDEPVVIHRYTTPADIKGSRNLAELGRFCRRMGGDARQGEVGLVVSDEYFAIRQFAVE